MSHTNEDIKKEGSEAHHHHTWVGNILEKIEEKIDNIDADFPLSGGAEPHHHHTHVKTEEEIAAEQEKAQHKKHSLLHDLNVDFPLSGGEE